MFVGHLGAALLAKRLKPAVPMSVLVGAAFGLDLLWPLLLFAGIETVRVDPGNTAFTGLDFVSYPWSHSLAATAVWSGLSWLVARRVWSSSGAGLVAGTVASHWLLDFVAHRPDLPLWPGGPRVGLGLWNSVPGTIAVEGALFLVAVVLYVRSSASRDLTGRVALWALLGVVGFAWLSGPWGPPPPSASAVAVVGLILWLLPPWWGWIERHRTWGGWSGGQTVPSG